MQPLAFLSVIPKGKSTVVFALVVAPAFLTAIPDVNLLCAYSRI